MHHGLFLPFCPAEPCKSGSDQQSIPTQMSVTVLVGGGDAQAIACFLLQGKIRRRLADSQKQPTRMPVLTYNVASSRRQQTTISGNTCRNGTFMSADACIDDLEWRDPERLQDLAISVRPKGDNAGFTNGVKLRVLPSVRESRVVA